MPPTAPICLPGEGSVPPSRPITPRCPVAGDSSREEEEREVTRGGSEFVELPLPFSRSMIESSPKLEMA